VNWASRACQPESSDGSARMQSVESAPLVIGTAVWSTKTASVAVAGTGTAAGHNSQSAPLDGTALPAVRGKAGRVLLWDCPGVVDLLFSSPSSLRLDSKQIALSSRCWKDGKV
jgi:hypothetical protein